MKRTTSSCLGDHLDYRQESARLVSAKNVRQLTLTRRPGDCGEDTVREDRMTLKMWSKETSRREQ